MRREDLYLNDIVEAVDHISAFIAGVGFDGFLGSEMMRSAVVQKLAIVGEAAARMPEPVKQQHTEVPWPQIVPFRNILIHAYFGIDWEAVWRSATKRCPVLREQVARIIAESRAAGAPSEER